MTDDTDDTDDDTALEILLALGPPLDWENQTYVSVAFLDDHLDKPQAQRQYYEVAREDYFWLARRHPLDFYPDSCRCVFRSREQAKAGCQHHLVFGKWKPDPIP